ncbi:MAG: hypothetical protein Q4A86_04490, partial [Clostridia bacterium]|nr:hypothetical protein [Clostridia bacterium]
HKCRRSFLRRLLLLRLNPKGFKRVFKGQGVAGQKHKDCLDAADTSTYILAATQVSLLIPAAVAPSSFKTPKVLNEL